jgi:hypothetical protein
MEADDVGRCYLLNNGTFAGYVIFALLIPDITMISLVTISISLTFHTLSQ